MNDDSNSEKPKGPLSDIRIIDLTAVVFGPLATQMLGDMGADIIKVEPPEGDMLRKVEPSMSGGMGAAFIGSNRNKRSIVLDLKHKPARVALIKLLETADVFVHSMRPQALEKLKLTADELSDINPNLIHVSALGFGSDGPYSGKPAYDDIVQSISGLADLACKRGDQAPQYAPTIIADKLGGVTAAYAIIAALFHRERTGEAQKVEVPMFETLASFLLVEHMAHATFEETPQTFGYNRMLVPHRKPLPTKDGFITILPYSNKQWRAFFDVCGRQDMFDDPRLLDMAERSRQIGSLYQLVGELTPTRTTKEWLELMEKADVPAAAVLALGDLPDDPHLNATGFFIKDRYVDGTEYWTTKPAVSFSKSPSDARRKPVPTLGEHSREILLEAGFSSNDIDEALKGTR